MKSIRLNKTIRTAIVENVITAWKKVNPEPILFDEQLRKMQQKLLEQAYQEWKDENKIDVLISCGMKPDYCNTDSSVYLEIVDDTGEQTHRIGYVRFRGSDGVVEKRIIKKHGGFVVKESSPAGKEYLEALKEKTDKQAAYKAWDTARYEKECEIRAVLESVNTTKQLLEVWPEIKEYIPASYVDPSRVQLPAILPTLP